MVLLAHCVSSENKLDMQRLFIRRDFCASRGNLMLSAEIVQRIDEGSTKRHCRLNPAKISLSLIGFYM